MKPNAIAGLLHFRETVNPFSRLRLMGNKTPISNRIKDF